jgi:hypothetical protein
VVFLPSQFWARPERAVLCPAFYVLIDYAAVFILLMQISFSHFSSLGCRSHAPLIASGAGCDSYFWFLRSLIIPARFQSAEGFLELGAS